MNTCNKCKQVKYCNASCKKKHRHKHKKHCERYLAELHDEKLFKQPPPAEDCPICFLRLPALDTGRRYKTCCGKIICSGCSYAPVYDNQGNIVDSTCAFCRVPAPETDEDTVERVNKRVEEAGDINAIFILGVFYEDGTNGYPQDSARALELWHRAGALGHGEAYCNIGIAYERGAGVEVDKKKAHHYYELAAIGGSINARFNLGNNEAEEGNMNRAMNHYMIAVKSGESDSLENVKRLYSIGHATKEDYMKALKLYQEYLGEIKSDQRDKAAAANEEYRYY